MPSMDSVVTGLGPVKAHVRAVAEEIAERWELYFIWGAPGRGTGDHAVGLALDFMAYELGGGVDSPGPIRHWVGERIADHLVANHDRLNLTYVIWDGQISSPLSDPDWSWRDYDGSNPHEDHVHVSFQASGTYRPPTPEPEEPDVAISKEELAAMLDQKLDERVGTINAYTARRTKAKVSEADADRYNFVQTDYQIGRLIADMAIRTRAGQQQFADFSKATLEGIRDLAKLISLGNVEQASAAAAIIDRLEQACVQVGTVQFDEPEEIDS